MLIFMGILPIFSQGAALVAAAHKGSVGLVGWGATKDMADLACPKAGSRKRTAATDCRRSPRFSQAEVPNMTKTNPADGPVARLINISRCGILLESAECMMPGGIVYLRLFASDAVFLLRGRVLRSRPTLLRNLHPLYESAVSLDGTFPVPVATQAGSKVLGPLAMPHDGPESGVRRSAGWTKASDAQPATYTMTASVPRSGPDLNQIFGLNSW